MGSDPRVPSPAERAQWLNAVDHHVTVGALSPADFRVAWRLANAHVNSKTGAAWPSQERLAADMGITGRSVRTSIARLRKAGLLTIARASRTDSNTMRLDLTHALSQPQRAPHDRKDSSSRDARTTGRILPLESPEHGNRMRYQAWLTGRILPVREEKSGHYERKDSSSESYE